MGVCGKCGNLKPLRRTGPPGVIGKIAKHRADGRWCKGGWTDPVDPDTFNLGGSVSGFGMNIAVCAVDERGGGIRAAIVEAIETWEPAFEADPKLVELLVAAFNRLPGAIAEPTPRDRLAQWWRDTAEAEIDMVVDKAIEYGATDLRDIGRAIAEMSHRELPDDTHGNMAAAEIGIVFYVLGKVSRLVAAVKEGRSPSVDTWLDIGVYARMAQRVHQTGAWPGI
jgi:hypothetical protein